MLKWVDLLLGWQQQGALIYDSFRIFELFGESGAALNYENQPRYIRVIQCNPMNKLPTLML
jgi:hypothetical protein